MTASDPAEQLTYWLDNPPTSNSDRYAMEQAARACLEALVAERAAHLRLRVEAQNTRVMADRSVHFHRTNAERLGILAAQELHPGVKGIHELEVRHHRNSLIAAQNVSRRMRYGLGEPYEVIE